MSKNKFVNIPPSVLALTQLARLRVTNNPVMPHCFFWFAMRTDRSAGGEKRERKERGAGGERLAVDDRHRPRVSPGAPNLLSSDADFIDRSPTRCRTIGSKKM
jgi:hypothetical protein